MKQSKLGVKQIESYFIVYIFAAIFIVVVCKISSSYITSSGTETGLIDNLKNGIRILLMVLLSISALYFFPSILVGIFQELRMHKSKYNFSIEILVTTLLYLLCVTLISLFAWSINPDNTAFFNAFKHSYIYPSENVSTISIIKTIQYISVLLLNAILLGIFAYVFTSRIDKNQNSDSAEYFMEHHPKLILTSCANDQNTYLNLGILEITQYHIESRKVDVKAAHVIKEILLENRYLLPNSVLIENSNPDIAFYMQVNAVIKSASYYPFFVFEKGYYALEQQGTQFQVIQKHIMCEVRKIEEYEKSLLEIKNI